MFKLVIYIFSCVGRWIFLLVLNICENYRKPHVSLTLFWSTNINGNSRLRRVSYLHYNDVIMGAIASRITGLTVAYSIVYSGADQRKHQSSASLTFVLRIHRWPVNSQHKGPVTRKMFPFDDVIILYKKLKHVTLLISIWDRKAFDLN